MQQIADEAGVNKALLHYYFRTKLELARAVYLRIASSFLPGIFAMMASDASLDDKIDRFVEAYLTRLARHPYLAAYIVSETTRHPELVPAIHSGERAKAAQRMVRKLRQQIHEQVTAGTMARVTPEQFVATLAGACIYPFAVRQMVTTILGVGENGFDDFIKQRRKELPAFLKRALRP
jgi:AcrR family transcriptional regulator